VEAVWGPVVLALVALVLVLARRLGLLRLLLRRIALEIAPGEPVSSSIDHAYPHLRTIRDLPRTEACQDLAEELARSGTVSLRPGVYDFDLQSFCLDIGKHSPSSGSRYLLGPLEGRRASALRRILRESARRPDVPQERVQSLVWGIASGARYEELTDDLKRLAERLLPERELFLLGKSYWRLVPGPVRRAVLRGLRNLLPDAWATEDAVDRVRSVLAHARATYEELERVVLRAGAAPAPEDLPAVEAGEWSLVGNGCLVRVFPQGYSRTRVQVYVPEPEDLYIERDDEGRVVRLGVRDGIDVELTYAGGREAVLDGGDAVPAWSFERVEFTGHDPVAGEETTVVADGSGWVAKDVEALAGLESAEHPELAPRIEAARDLCHDAAMLRRARRRRSSSPGIALSYAASGGDDHCAGSGDEAVDEGAEGDRDPVKDIKDVGHYLDGLEAVLEELGKPSMRKKMEWLVEHFRRLRRAYEYAANRIAELGDPFGNGGPGGEGGEDRGGSFGLGGSMAIPQNPNEQGLGFRG